MSLSDEKNAAVASTSDKVSDRDVERRESVPINTYHDQPWFTAVRENPKAVAACCYMLFTCIMWGYDGLAGAIVLAIGKFREDYGYEYQGQYVVSAGWQMGFTAASLFGIIFGGYATGMATKYVTQKACVGTAYVLTVAGVFAQWFSPGDLPLFFAGKLLTGIPLGVFLTVAPTYCSEVAPPKLRGAMIAAVNWAMVVGQLLGYGVMREVQAIPGAMSYRTMFAVQWGFAAVGLALLPFCPESPTRLAARGKTDAARTSIARLHSPGQVDEKLREIETTLSAHAVEAAHAGGYRDCFNRKNRLRTIIVMSVYFFQANSGVGWVVGYMGYFLQLSGMQGAEVFDTTVGIAGLMAVGNMAAWYLVEKLGRRRTIFWGLLFCTISLLLIGVLALFISHGRPVVLAQVAFMAVWAFCYQGSIGAAGFTMMAEVPTSSLRGVTQSLATMVNGLTGAIWVLSMPYLVNPDEANLGGKVAFIFFPLLVLADMFVYFYYPETKGRSFEEIDELFHRGISPRLFHKTRLN